VATKVRGLSDATLKVVGLALVGLASLGTAVVQRGMPTDLSQAEFSQLTAAVLIEIVSWAAIPLYAWLLCAGMTHSRNLRRYGLRLAVLAVVSEVPYDLATSGRAWDLSSQNPVFALLVCLVVLSALIAIRRRGGSTMVLLSVVVIAAGLVWLVFFNIGLRLGLMPTGVLLLGFCLIFFYLAERVNLMMMVAAVLGALAVVAPAFGLVILHFRNEQSGLRSPVQRWVFYAMYPVVLLAAAGAAVLV
jgi:hypothetical protein